VVVVNTCGFSTPAKQEPGRHRQAMARTAASCAGCFGIEKEHSRRAPGVLAVTGPHQYEEVVAAVLAVPPLHDPFLDLVPPEGCTSRRATTRISRSRRLQQPLLVLLSRSCEAASPAVPSPKCWPRPSGW
jgi:tRNA A37 methylthiotransferase MiaB